MRNLFLARRPECRKRRWQVPVNPNESGVTIHAVSHLESFAAHAGVKVPPLLTPANAAQLLGVTVATMRRWVREGRIPAIRVSPRVTFIRKDELAAFLDRTPYAAHAG